MNVFPEVPYDDTAWIYYKRNREIRQSDIHKRGNLIEIARDIA